MPTGPPFRITTASVEHYEITRYGSLIAWAKELGRNDCAALLQQNLDEEKATDRKLTSLAGRRLYKRRNQRDTRERFG